LLAAAPSRSPHLNLPSLPHQRLKPLSLKLNLPHQRLKLSLPHQHLNPLSPALRR
jgi:hypothetical protein